MKKVLKCDMFEGEQENALMSALMEASGANFLDRDNELIYKFLEDTPKTSLIVDLVQNLNNLGYKIVSKKRILL